MLGRASPSPASRPAAPPEPHAVTPPAPLTPPLPRPLATAAPTAEPEPARRVTAKWRAKVARASGLALTGACTVQAELTSKGTAIVPERIMGFAKIVDGKELADTTPTPTGGDPMFSWVFGSDTLVVSDTGPRTYRVEVRLSPAPKDVLDEGSP